jgi:predicted metal-dependent peptidase
MTVLPFNTEIALRDKAPIAAVVTEHWPKLALTSEQQRLWDETRAAVLWALPFISDVWYAMMVDKDGAMAYFTDKVPIAATDDTFMYLNPATFFPHTLDERVFICAHEVMHCVFNHCGLFWRLRQEQKIRYPDGVSLYYIEDLMQIAADCVINAMLVVSKVGGLPKGCWHVPKVIPSTYSVLEAYRKLYKPKKNSGGGSGDDDDGSGCELPSGGRSFDIHLRPGQGRGKTPNEAESERSPQQWINAINAAIESGKMAGNMPAEMERLFRNIMKKEVDWIEPYQVCVGKKLGRDGLSWLYLNDEYVLRGIGFPGRVKYACDFIAVFVDTSGSIGQRTMDHFLGVTQGILEVLRPKRLLFAECDCAIHCWREIEDINDLDGKVHGGGGTDFKPPFERLKQEGEDPDLVIYLTDLYGDFPNEPNYPVIWACINTTKAPWGETVHVPELANEKEQY